MAQQAVFSAMSRINTSVHSVTKNAQGICGRAVGACRVAIAKAT